MESTGVDIAGCRWSFVGIFIFVIIVVEVECNGRSTAFEGFVECGRVLCERGIFQGDAAAVIIAMMTSVGIIVIALVMTKWIIYSVRWPQSLHESSRQFGRVCYYTRITKNEYTDTITMQMERNEALFVGDLVEYYLNGGIRAAQCNTYIKGWGVMMC